MFFFLFLHLLLNCIVSASNTLFHTMITQDSIPSKTYLALGDSYTIGEAVLEMDRFPVQVVQKLNASGIRVEQPEIIAATGWTTGDLIRAIDKQSFSRHYDLVTLLIGVNNQYQGRSEAEYNEEFEILLKRSIQLAGENPAHVIVLSIPDYSVTPFAARTDLHAIAIQIDRLNSLNKSIAAKYNAQWMDISEESRRARLDPTLIAADGLHFSGKEYTRWAELLFPMIRGALQ